MHANRILYSLPEYQGILRNRSLNLGIVCENTATGNFLIFHPIPATPWLPEGRKKYFRKLYARAKRLNPNKKFSFCTLTYSSRRYTPEQAAKRVKHDLDKFFKRLNYRKSKPQYFYVIELTEKKMVHIHLIFDRFVHKRKIFKSWFKVTGSTAIKIKALAYKNAINYMLKYLTKAKKMPENYFEFLFKNIDRLWTASRQFFAKEDPDKEKAWSFYFLLFDKDAILFNYLSYLDLEDKKDLSPPEAELLHYDAEKLNCIIHSA